MSFVELLLQSEAALPPHNGINCQIILVTEVLASTGAQNINKTLFTMNQSRFFSSCNFSQNLWTFLFLESVDGLAPCTSLYCKFILWDTTKTGDDLEIFGEYRVTEFPDRQKYSRLPLRYCFRFTQVTPRTSDTVSECSWIHLVYYDVPLTFRRLEKVATTWSEKSWLSWREG